MEEAKIFLKNYDGVNVEVAREHYLFLRNWADARYQTLRRLLENEDEPVSVEDAGVMMDEIAEFLQIAESISYRFQAHHSKRIDERAFLFGDHTRPKYDHTPPSAVSSNDISENDELATVRRHALISFPLLDGHFPFAEY